MAPPILSRILLAGAEYLVPRPDGRLLVGSTEEDAGFDKHSTAEAIAGLLSLGCKLVPSLGQAPVERCWAGLRPGTPDELPILGETSTAGYFVATGHYRDGILLAANDNWKETQQTALESTGLAPKNDSEAAALVRLGPGQYTAILRGKSGSTGVGLVELYRLP